MEANFIFGNVKAYNVERADVLLGETFRIELPQATDYTLQWFTSNDPVLEVVTDTGSTSAQVGALSVGDSEIRLYEGDNLVKRLNLSVYSVEAASLNPKAGKATLK
jgi:hypothetical protein